MCIGIHQSPQDMLISSRRHFNSTIFREVIMVVGWMIWCHQNAIIFDGALVFLLRCKVAFIYEFPLIIHRAKPLKRILLQNWLSSL
jgi:hypothetical protein